METTLAEFLMGMFAGTITGLLAVLTRTTNRVSRRFSKPRAQAIRRRKAKAMGARRNISSSRTNTLKPRARHILPVNHDESPPPVAPLPVQTIASCPSCGLEAPESLMAEHFLGSPSHENPRVLSEEETVEGPAEPVEVDDSKGELRTLLQMLVPPRAFGHRRQQKTQNPLSDYVTPIGPVRKLSMNPLRDPL